MPYPPRQNVIDALKAGPCSFPLSFFADKEFYLDFITEEYVNNRRLEIKVNAGLKASCPKAPQPTIYL